MNSTGVQEPLRCHDCNLLIMERVGSPWRYTCRRCKAKQSSSGLRVPGDYLRRNYPR